MNEFSRGHWSDGWRWISVKHSVLGFTWKRYVYLLNPFYGNSLTNLRFFFPPPTHLMCMWFAFSYGLPVNFQAILMHPNKKSTKRLRDVLNQLYSHLDGSAAAPSGNLDVKPAWPTVLCAYCSLLLLFFLSSPECGHSWSWFWPIRILPVCLL